MPTRVHSLLILLLCGLTRFAHGQTFPPAGNLIMNGDFESGFSGWNGTYGLLTLQNYPMNPAPLSGTTVGVSLAGEPVMDQTISTVIGTTYEIKIGMRLPDLGGNGIPIEGDSHGDPALISVIWEGGTAQQILVQNRNTWNIFTLDVVAQSTSSDLAFLNPQFYFDANHQLEFSASPFLDNISVVAVPEPATTALLGVGTLLFFHQWFVRKRSSKFVLDPALGGRS